MTRAGCCATFALNSPLWICTCRLPEETNPPAELLLLGLPAIETAIAPEAATDGEDCTTLPNTAPLVPVTTGDDRVATGVGGTVAAGTYYLTSVVRTPSSILPQMTFHQTLRISGNTIESVAQDNDKPAYTVVSTITTSGASIAFSLVCSTQNGSGGDLQYDSYTADDSHLILYGVTIGITVTFTRQG